MALKGLLRLFLTGLPSGVAFFGPWATRGERSIRAGWRFWKLATPRVCRHGAVSALEKACASQKGHAEDVSRSMLRRECLVVCTAFTCCHMSLLVDVNFLCPNRERASRADGARHGRTGFQSDET